MEEFQGSNVFHGWTDFPWNIDTYSINQPMASACNQAVIKPRFSFFLFQLHVFQKGNSVCNQWTPLLKWLSFVLSVLLFNSWIMICWNIFVYLLTRRPTLISYWFLQILKIHGRIFSGPEYFNDPELPSQGFLNCKLEIINSSNRKHHHLELKYIIWEPLLIRTKLHLIQDPFCLATSKQEFPRSQHHRLFANYHGSNLQYQTVVLILYSVLSVQPQRLSNHASGAPLEKKDNVKSGFS